MTSRISRCKRCKRPIYVFESVLRGYGPVCAAIVFNTRALKALERAFMKRNLAFPK